MKIDETTLLAYVDGELGPMERSSVELALEHNAELRAQLAALRASCLPYRAAFDAQSIPELPAVLQQQLAALSAVTATGGSVQQGVSGAKGLKNRAYTGFYNRFALAAAFVTGAFSALVFGSLWTTSNETVAGMAEWVKPIASYQALYVRDTVDRTADSAERAVMVIQDFESESGQAPLVVPDLSAAGFEFKRIQRLGIRVTNTEMPLIQMAYLPLVGKPGALCVLRNQGGVDVAVKAQRMDNLSVVTWTRGKLSYVFAVDMPLDQAVGIGEKLDAGWFPSLYKS
jgi:anti-sigma factor RsiW